MVTRIDRLARSIGDLQDIVRAVKAKGATLKATEQPIDTSTAAGKCFLDMLGVFAEFETNLRKERQLEGIAKPRREASTRPQGVDRPREGQAAQGGGHGAVANRQSSQDRPRIRLPRPGSMMLRHPCDITLANKVMTLGHCRPILAAALPDGEVGVKLEFCVACGSKDGLQHGHLLKGGAMLKLIGSPCALVAMTSCTNSATARVSTASASRPQLLLDGRAVPASADQKS